MGILGPLVRRSARVQVPARFAGVGERVQAGDDASSACAEVGREMARDGADLGEALDGLETTYARVQGGQPDLRAVRALCLAWSEESLRYLHQLSCEDPLTGLASLAHLRARIAELSRGGDAGGTSMAASHALVVIDLPLPAPAAAWDEVFEAQLLVVRVGETTRMVFAGEGTTAQVRAGRLLLLVRRDNALADRVGLVRDLLGDVLGNFGTERARVWIEGLPSSDVAAGHLLDELARGRPAGG